MRTFDKGIRVQLGVIIQDHDGETADALDIDTRNGALIADIVKIIRRSSRNTGR